VEAHRGRYQARCVHDGKSIRREAAVGSHERRICSILPVARKATGQVGIGSELYSEVISLPDAKRSSREAANAAVEAELRREGRSIWIYPDDFDNGNQRKIGDADRVKPLARTMLARRWSPETQS